MSTLSHYTITTGHIRPSPRSEVGPGITDALRPLLRAGEHPMPGPPGYRLRVTIEGTAFAATVLRASDGAPLATTIVCLTEDDLAKALAATGAKPTAAIELPAAIVDLYPTTGLDRDALGWLSDFERCLAWAWVDLSRCLS